MLTRNIRCLPTFAARYSTVAEPLPKIEDFRTNETNTGNHTIKHAGRFYRIAPDEKKQIFSYGGLPKSFEKQIKTFGETCLMVREPALEIIHYIKTCDLSKPSVRYVLYGNDGTGRSLTMAHLLHFGLQNNFVLVHVPWVPNWFKKPKEIANSTTKEGFIDLPIDAAAWLVHFKAQNSKILQILDLKTSKDYVWSKRETTPAGSTLVGLIEHGIARIKFACDTIEVLLWELKQQSTAGKCKVLVAVDGYNAFFHTTTRIIADNKAKIAPHQVTLTKPFVDITGYDWCNGVCVLAVDRLALTEDRMESVLPRYQLGKEGFDYLDPFVPVKVDNYNEKEMDNCIKYYLDRRWIQNVQEGFDKELRFLSGCNPYKLMNLCAPL